MEPFSITECEFDKLYDASFASELVDTFFSKGNTGNVYHVSLNSNGLLLSREMVAGGHKNHVVNICDIIGGRCVCVQKVNVSYGAVGTCGVCTPSVTEKKKNQNDSTDAYLYVFAYILKQNIRKTLRRVRTVITLRFRSYDNHEDNMREAERWCKTLKHHRNNHLLLRKIQCVPTLKSYQKVFKTKRLLILLNPKSGSGKARQSFNNYVETILNEADIPYDLHVTKNSNYAHNFVRFKDLSYWSGIVSVGGDGLFHEILNGLLKRKDWNSVINNISLGIVPCGSGNGLARSIAHYFHEPYEPKPILGASLSLVSDQTALMDVVEIEQPRKMMYSFLSVGWGLISDIDIESERLRSLGYQRFTIWTIHRLINLRTYRGRVSYLSKNDFDDKNTPDVVNISSLQHRMNCNSFTPPHELKKLTSSISNSEFEDVISLETTTNHSYRSRCNSLISSGSRVSTYYSISESVYHSIAGNSDYNETNVLESENMEELHGSRLGYSDKNKCSLQDPLPNTWSVENGDFVMVHAAYQSHLGSDCNFSPKSKLNDGVIYLVMIRGGISRSQLFNFLINMSSGTHIPKINTDFIKVEKVVAFRLEPEDNSGILTVDGERIESGALQAQIYPGIVNVMVPNVVFK